MKAIITLILIAGAFHGLAATPESLTTTDGTTYQHISSLRADPDGLYIEYTPAGSGLGCAKVKFSRLSADLQKQYGYDPAMAKQYENDSYQGALAYQAWADQRDAARLKAQADATAFQLQENALFARSYAMASQPSDQSMNAYSAPGYIGGYGYSYPSGNRASRNTWTGTTFTGSLPIGTLFTPLGFQPTKITVIPATRPLRPGSVLSVRR